MVDMNPVIIVVTSAVIVTIAAVLFYFQFSSLRKTTTTRKNSNSVSSPELMKDDRVSKHKKKKSKSSSSSTPALQVLPKVDVNSAVKSNDNGHSDEKKNAVNVTSKGSHSANHRTGTQSKTSKKTVTLATPEAEPTKPSAEASSSASDSLIQEVDVSLGNSDVEDWAVVKTKKKTAVNPPTSSSLPSGAATASAVSTIESAASPAPTSLPSEHRDEPVVSASVPEVVVDKTVDEIVVPAKKLGAIIGVKGAVKISLQSLTGTEISLPKVPKESVEPVTVTITGISDGVKKAKKAIQDLVTKGYTPLLEGEDFRETQVTVNPR